MGHVDELGLEWAKLHDIAGLDFAKVDLLGQLMLAQLVLDEAERQPAPVNRRGNLGQDVGQRSDMVFVAVGQQKAEHLFLPLGQVGDIRQHQVDAEHLLFGEHQAGVDHDDLLVVFENHHVAPDLAQSPERDGAQARLLSQKA